MTERKLNLITIGLAKRALDPDSRDHKRMQRYATALSQLHVIVLTRQIDDLPERLQVGNLFIYGTNTKTKVGMLFAAYRIGKAILKNESTSSWVVSSQDPFETSLVGRVITKAKNATHHVQIHGDVFNPASYKSSLLNRLRVIYGRYVVRRTKLIRVVSDRIRRSLLLLGVKESAVRVLPIQSDLDDFLRVGEERQYVQGSQVSFLYIGRFSTEKNIPLLLQAFAEATKEKNNATLNLVGAGSERPIIDSLIEQLGIADLVQISDWTENVANEMATHDVVCLSSDHEGWGMVLLEAAASGSAVVTTDVGCAGEVIRGGENGGVVPVDDIVEYARALALYINQSELVEKHGRTSRIISKEFISSEQEYLQRWVESHTSLA